MASAALAPTQLKQANAAMAAATADHVRTSFAAMQTSARTMSTAAAAALQSVQVCAQAACAARHTARQWLTAPLPLRRGAQSTTETLRSAKAVLLEVAAAADDAAAAESVFDTTRK